MVRTAERLIPGAAEATAAALKRKHHPVRGIRLAFCKSIPFRSGEGWHIPAQKFPVPVQQCQFSSNPLSVKHSVHLGKGWCLCATSLPSAEPQDLQHPHVYVYMHYL